MKTNLKESSTTVHISARAKRLPNDGINLNVTYCAALTQQKTCRMNHMERACDEIIKSILDYDSEKVVQSTKKALDIGVEAVEIVEKAINPALSIIGKKFETGEFFLYDLVAAGETVSRVMKEVLEPELLKKKATGRASEKVVLGTVKGDIHSIGKNIVAAMFTASGFEVYDLGEDVPVERFIEKAKEVDADVVGASALLSTTLPQQREIVKAFVKADLRDKTKLMFGGAAVTKEWVEEIGGDAYAEDALEAVKIAKSLLKHG